MSKVGLISGIVRIVMAVIAFVFADGLRRWYSGIFFTIMGTVMLSLISSTCHVNRDVGSIE